MWNSITDFGDSAVGLPLAALVLLALLASGWLRGAGAWLVAVLGCGAAMALFKVAFKVASGSCESVMRPVVEFSPSGHAALSTVVYGGLAVLGARQLPPAARWLLGAATGLWVLLIACSRVEVQAHTPVEVLIGLAVGAGALCLMAFLIRRSPAPRVLLPQLAVALSLALLLMYGTHWPVESGLRMIAALFRQSVVDCGA